MTLKDFPRGGKLPPTKVPLSLLPHKKEKHKAKKFAKKNDDELFLHKEETFALNTAECLTYKTLLEGMTVLGRIHAVTDYDIAISIPGRLSGKIPITNISETYNNLLQCLVESTESQPSEFKPLPELYKRGNYLVCYIKSTDADGKYQVTLSLEPHLINRNLDPTQLKKGTKMVCSISSVEDHGYIIDTGIKTLRGFLSNDDIDNNVKYYLGQQIFCSVKSVKSYENITTIKLSTKSKLRESISNLHSQPLDGMIPGTRLNLNVTKILSNGLQVTFNNDNIGYINQLYLSKPLSSYESDTEINGTLMYILPTVKFAYFTQQQSFDNEKESIKIGEIVENAKVLYKDSKGIVFNLKKKLKGFLPFKRSEVNYEEINAKFTPDSLHKCRILTYDIFDRIYICSMQQNILKEDVLLPEAAQPGDVTDVEIVKINDNGFIFVKSGQIIGNVAPEHISDINEDQKSWKQLKVGNKMKARVLGKNKQGNGLMFTLKKSLVESNHPILSNINDAKIGSKYQGTIITVKKAGLIVRFFGDVKGWIPASSLDKNSGGTLNYIRGQVVFVKIKEIDKDNEKLILNIVGSKKKEKGLNKINTIWKIGDLVEGTVVESSINGIYLRIKLNNDSDTVTGFLPACHMAPCSEIGTYLSTKYVPGDKLSALIFSKTPELLLTRTFSPQKEFTVFDDLKINDCIPCSIKEINTKGLKIILPIESYENYEVIPYHKIENIETLIVNQILFGKIIGINKKEKKLFLTTSLREVWAETVKYDSDMIAAVDLLTLYFSKLKELFNHECYNNKKIASMHLGQRVSGIVDKITDYGLILKLNNDVTATVRHSHFNGTFEKGDKIEGSVLWINYIHELVEVTLLPALVNKISTKQNKLTNISLETQLRGEIILVTNWFILILLKGQGKGTLAALPSRRHPNDLKPDLSPYSIGKKIRCYAILNRNEAELLPICLVKSAFEAKKAELLKTNLLKRKIKVEEHKNNDDLGEKIKRRKTSIDNNKKPMKSKIQSSHDDNQVEVIGSNKKNDEVKDDNKAVKMEDLSIPECGFFWDVNPDLELLKRQISDSEDEEETVELKKKIKKLNATERRELERQKEREIREREEALASNQIPNSVDQFDRLVLASPDSSMIWMQYMAYHLQATEIEKARIVAKRALKTINFREENEKLNVWQAWLNLESRFGSPESLNDVFHQAINANDAMKVYLHMLAVHLDAGRQAELEKTVKTIIGKFKDIPEVWTECGNALLRMGLKEKSRVIMQRALQSLPPQEHVNLMVKFAQSENKFGDKDRAETLFENILISYPKRVDVWTTYVDSLIKNENFDSARKVLEKAVAQTLPVKKMKTLFKKFVAFEEQHGTPEGVIHAKELAVAYIENITNKSINN